MLHDQNALFNELDDTLNQLLQNTKTLTSPMVNLLQQAEIDLINKTQESLAAHFVHTKLHLTLKKSKKLEKLEDKTRLVANVAPALLAQQQRLCKQPVVGARPKIGKNRKLLEKGEFAYCAF